MDSWLSSLCAQCAHMSGFSVVYTHTNKVYTYVLQAGGAQTLGLLVTGVFHILDLGGLVALVQTNGDFVADSHLATKFNKNIQNIRLEVRSLIN